MHMPVHAFRCMQERVSVCKCVPVRACQSMQVRGCVGAWVRVGACVGVWMRACVRVCLCACVLTCVHLFACLCAYLCAYGANVCIARDMPSQVIYFAPSILQMAGCGVWRIAHGIWRMVPLTP